MRRKADWDQRTESEASLRRGINRNRRSGSIPGERQVSWGDSTAQEDVRTEESSIDSMMRLNYIVEEGRTMQIKNRPVISWEIH